MTTRSPEPNPPCPFCGAPARAGSRATHVRRGERVLAIDVQHWECATGCLDEDGTSPFRFEDAVLLRKNDESIRAAWQEKFREPLPSTRRPGRKPPERRDVRVQILLTPSEAEILDRSRGEVPRSEFIRKRLLRAS